MRARFGDSVLIERRKATPLRPSIDVARVAFRVLLFGLSVLSVVLSSCSAASLTLVDGLTTRPDPFIGIEKGASCPATMSAPTGSTMAGRFRVEPGCTGRSARVK